MPLRGAICVFTIEKWKTPEQPCQGRFRKIIFYFFRFYVIIALESGWLVHSLNLQLISFFIPSLSFHFKIFFSTTLYRSRFFWFWWL